MTGPLDISEVCRRTGLTSRALRFYEARGLLRPLRTSSGRRLYGPGEIKQIHDILALKRAGLTLAKIKAVMAGRSLDLSAVIEAQLQMLNKREAEVAEARALLLSVKSRLDRGEIVDAATFCWLIKHGENVMENEQWKAILEEQYTPRELEHWKENPPPMDFDQAEYSRKWKELGGRVQAALPLDPASDQAQSFVKEWDDLLEPFTRVATPQMMEGAQRFWDNADRHGSRVELPFSPEVMQFIQQAKAAGGIC